MPTELAFGQTVLLLLLPQQLGSLLNDTVFDPNTGIIAGFLNARDDLATAVLTANDDFPSALGTLATTEWANMPELAQATASSLLADLGTLFNPARFCGSPRAEARESVNRRHLLQLAGSVGLASMVSACSSESRRRRLVPA